MSLCKESNTPTYGHFYEEWDKDGIKTNLEIFQYEKYFTCNAKCIVNGKITMARTLTTENETSVADFVEQVELEFQNARTD